MFAFGCCRRDRSAFEEAATSLNPADRRKFLTEKEERLRGDLELMQRGFARKSAALQRQIAETVEERDKWYSLKHDMHNYFQRESVTVTPGLLSCNRKTTNRRIELWWLCDSDGRALAVASGALGVTSIGLCLMAFVEIHGHSFHGGGSVAITPVCVAISNGNL
jgi:hypothetical protein